MSGAACLNSDAGGFVDPRAGKTNLLRTPIVYGLTTVANDGAIIGADGVTANGTRLRSTGSNGRFVVNGPQVQDIVNGSRYTASAYIRTTALPLFGVGNSSALGMTPGLVIVGSLPQWTLVEHEQVAQSNIVATNWTLWFGAGNSFTTGEIIDVCLPMVYAGPKVT